MTNKNYKGASAALLNLANISLRKKILMMPNSFTVKHAAYQEILWIKSCCVMA